MNAPEPTAEQVEALAEVVWTASRADESTISGIGAQVVARAVLASGYVPPDVVAEVEREWAEAQEHIARWLDDHPPLSTSERIQQGSTGDLAVDMMRYATRLKNRAEAAEARTAAVLAAVEALADEWTSATCQTDGAPCSWHRVSAECAAELRAAAREAAAQDGATS